MRSIRRCSARCPAGVATSRTCSPGSRPRPRPASHRSSSTAWCSAASTMARCCDWRAFAREHGHVLRFIEYMDVGTCNGWSRERVVPSAELRDAIHAHWPLRPLDPHYRGEVAARYAYADGGGEIGFVSSVSEPFCGDCHRARVSADGQLYTCLFAGDGHDLRPALAQGKQHWSTALPASGRDAWIATANCVARDQPAQTCRDVPHWWLSESEDMRAQRSCIDASRSGRPAGHGRRFGQARDRARSHRRMPGALPGRRGAAVARIRPEERQGRRRRHRDHRRHDGGQAHP